MIETAWIWGLIGGLMIGGAAALFLLAMLVGMIGWSGLSRRTARSVS